MHRAYGHYDFHDVHVKNGIGKKNNWVNIGSYRYLDAAVTHLLVSTSCHVTIVNLWFLHTRIRFCIIYDVFYILQTLARHLAEVLLRGMCESNYVTVDLNKSQSSKNSTLKPRKYSGERFVISFIYTWLIIKYITYKDMYQ